MERKLVIKKADDELLGMSWPSASDAMNYLRRYGTTPESLGLAIGMAEKTGVCLFKFNPPGLNNAPSLPRNLKLRRHDVGEETSEQEDTTMAKTTQRGKKATSARARNTASKRKSTVQKKKNVAQQSPTKASGTKPTGVKKGVCPACDAGYPVTPNHRYHKGFQGVALYRCRSGRWEAARA